MKFKGTIWLTAAFIGLVLYHFLIDVPTEKRQKEEKARSEKVLLFEAEDVESLTLSGKNGPVTLERVDASAWNMTEPVEALGDSATVSDFLSLLKQLNFIRIVEETPEDISVFGLDTPSLQISLSLKNGKERGIRIGDDHPMGGKIYLTRAGEDKVLTASVARNQLDLSVYELRDKSVLTFDTSQVIKLERVRNDKALTFEKKENTWSLSEEVSTARGDADEILNLINTIRAARIKKFIDERPETLAPFGLDQPTLRLTLTDSKSDTTFSLLVGIEKDKEYYAKTVSGKNVFAIDKEFFDRLNNSRLVDFMKKTLIDLKGDEVASLAIRAEGEDIRIVRNEDDKQKWTLEHPVKERANSAAVNNLLFDLKDIRVAEFIKTSATDLKPFGLGPPKKKLIVTDKDGKDWSLSLGELTTKKNHHFAQRTGEEAVFTLKTTDVEKIFRSLHDLKDRTLLGFKKEKVERVEVRYPNQTFELKRSGTGWRLTQPERVDPIQGFIGNDILWTLNALEFESVVSSPPGGEVMGFNRPQLRVDLWDKNNQSQGHVEVGNPVPESLGLHYLRVGEKAGTYTIKKRFLDEIPDNINKFKKKPSSG
jgi:hypothetical protein